MGFLKRIGLCKASQWEQERAKCKTLSLELNELELALLCYKYKVRVKDQELQQVWARVQKEKEAAGQREERLLRKNKHLRQRMQHYKTVCASVHDQLSQQIEDHSRFRAEATDDLSSLHLQLDTSRAAAAECQAELQILQSQLEVSRAESQGFEDAAVADKKALQELQAHLAAVYDHYMQLTAEREQLIEALGSHSSREQALQEALDSLSAELAAVGAEKDDALARAERAEAALAAAKAQAGMFQKMTANLCEQKKEAEQKLEAASCQLETLEDGITHTPEARFQEKKVLGRGGFGRVTMELVQCQQSRQAMTVAVKEALDANRILYRTAEACDSAPANDGVLSSSQGSSPADGAVQIGAYTAALAQAATWHTSAASSASDSDSSGGFSSDSDDDEESEEQGNGRQTRAAQVAAEHRATDAAGCIEREASIMETLPQHQNVVTFLGYKGCGKRRLLLEFAPDGSLHDMLWHKSGRVKRVFSADEQLHIGLQLVAGLRHIHVNNVAHCDVKLANVLVFPGQRCKLCDFGIAERVVDGRISRNFLFGTWGLINPLSALDVGSAGQQDDIWALGCALYGLLTGRDLCKEFCAQLVRLKADPRQRQKIKDACRTLDLKPKQTNALITAQLKGLVRTPKAVPMPCPDSVAVPAAYIRLLDRCLDVSSWQRQPVTLDEFEQVMRTCLQQLPCSC